MFRLCLALHKNSYPERVVEHSLTQAQFYLGVVGFFVEQTPIDEVVGEQRGVLHKRGCTARVNQTCLAFLVTACLTAQER
jgi:hypothetical protein